MRFGEKLLLFLLESWRVSLLPDWHDYHATDDYQTFYLFDAEIEDILRVLVQAGD